MVQSGAPAFRRSRLFFAWVTRFPRLIVVLGVVIVLGALVQLPKITRDTTIDVFMPVDHPALSDRDLVEETFGLRDPLVIAVIGEGEHGIFTPSALEYISTLTNELGRVPNIDPERIRSLATEKNILGTSDGLLVNAFLDPQPKTLGEAEQVREAVLDIPLYKGTLVSTDGSATLITAELVNQQLASPTYEAIEALIAGLDRPDVEIHIAGEGAVTGYLSTYLNEDARRLQPIAVSIILLVMVVGFRTLLAFTIPLVIIISTAGGALGLMAFVGVPYYIITAALPVILIGISVADSIHLFSRYYEEYAMDPAAEQRELIIRTMSVMWRPIVLTSLTTAGGFAGIAITSDMPPMFWFGVFAIVGVMLALVYSLIFLPAAMCLYKAHASPAFKPDSKGESHDMFARGLQAVGLAAMARPYSVLFLALVIVTGGIVGALHLEVDRDRIGNFAPSAPIRQAHDAINQRFDGTSYFDIMVEAPEAEGLFDIDRLRRLEALQIHVHSLPQIHGTVSIIDYLKQMHKAMNGNDPAFYRLPQDEDLIAQYVLLYSVMGGPTDFQEEIDYDYRMGLLRTMTDETRFTTDRKIVQAVDAYVQKALADSDLTLRFSGGVNMSHHWMTPLARDHFLSIAVSLSFVFLLSAVLFRSLIGGLLALAPVIVGVLAVYAAMGVHGIWLQPATSMFAAISIGLGVDFSIHIIDRLRFLVKDSGMPLEEAFRHLYPTAGRALFFNFAGVFFGFGLMVLSEMPPLHSFGILVSVAMVTNFLAAVLILPALIMVLRPRFIGLGRSQ